MGACLHAGQSVTNKKAVLVLSTAVLLGVVGIVIARGVHEGLPLIGLAFWRWLAAACILLPFVWSELRAKSHIVRQNIKLLSLQGFFIVAGGTLVFYALNFTTAINASLVSATQPVMTALLVFILLKQYLKPLQLGGILFAFLGVGVIITEAQWQVIASFNFNRGDILVILGVLCYAFYALNVRRLPIDLSSLASLSVTLLIGSLFLVPVYIAESLFDRPFPLSAESVMVVLVLAVFVSILSVWLWTYGNSLVSPARAAVFVNLTPVFGILLSVVFLGEELTRYHIVGVVLVCSGILFVIKNDQS